MAESQFRTVLGIIQFDPRDGNAGGKEVRNITIRTTGLKDQSVKVGATLWPSHGHIAVSKGDVVVLEGKFSQTEGTNKDGETVKYNNLSVSDICVLGSVDSGSKVETTNTPTADDDDIPF